MSTQIQTENIKKQFDAFLKQIEKQQIKRLQRLGEMCVNYARSVPKSKGFEDRTGNLRSSIGYMVFVDGVAVHSFYETVSGKKAGVALDGAERGQALAEKVGKEKTGICLVVTAGMNYAVHLEATGRDVVTGAELLAAKELPRMLDSLVKNIEHFT